MGYLVMALTRIVSKKNQREVTQKVRKWEQLFLHAAHHLYLIHIAIKFHPDIPYDWLPGYGVYKESLKKNNQWK